jgi:hypothetical protein
MQTMNAEATQKAIEDARIHYLNTYPTTVPEAIQQGVKQAVALWFEQHKAKMIEAIAEQAR